jgi:hypothetical protein
VFGVEVGGTYLPATASLRTKFDVRFPDPIGDQSLAQASLTFPFDLPANDEMLQAVELLKGQIPLQWPPAGTPLNRNGVTPAPPSSVDWATPRNALEQGITSHMPYGEVLSIDQPRSAGKVAGTQRTYGLDNDSAIWTGHYLAAEAFRYAATSDQAALDRVQRLLDGIQQSFDVTTDAVLENKRYTPVTSNYAGIFARSTMSSTDALGWTDTIASHKKAGSCLYVRPSGGWVVGNKKYKTLRQAVAGGGKATPLDVRPVEDTKHPVLYGIGCGNRAEADHPISRDAYSGVFLGLATAYQLVPGVRDQVRKLVVLRYFVGRAAENGRRAPSKR